MLTAYHVVPMKTKSRSPMERWVSVLNAFVDRDEWGVRELASTADLSPTATHRMLHQMVQIGLLAPAVARGRFRVGPELLRLSVLIAERLDVRLIARPILESTSSVIGETVVLALYSRTRGQFWAADAVESTHTIRYIWESLRSWNDLYRGASGKGILAFLPDDEREAMLVAVREPDRSALRIDLDEARKRGFVISHGERFVGAVGVSAPIRDATSQVIGDLIATWPDNRTDSDKEAWVAEVVVDAAGELSRGLGHVEHRRATVGDGPAPQSK
jgi:DNA-binding IclR family transcriptional regulator